MEQVRLTPPGVVLSLEIPSRVSWQAVLGKVLTYTVVHSANTSPAPSPLPAPEAGPFICTLGAFQSHRHMGAWLTSPQQSLRLHIWAVLLLPYFLICHIFSIFQKFIKANGLRMSPPDLKTAINLLPLVLLNFISMGFMEGEEIRYVQPVTLNQKPHSLRF